MTDGPDTWAMAEALVSHLDTCSRDPEVHDEFHCDCGTWEIHHAIAEALAAERRQGYVDGVARGIEMMGGAAVDAAEVDR